MSSFKDARGALPLRPGQSLPEEAIRLRDGGPEDLEALPSFEDILEVVEGRDPRTQAREWAIGKSRHEIVEMLAETVSMLRYCNRTLRARHNEEPRPESPAGARSAQAGRAEVQAKDVRVGDHVALSPRGPAWRVTKVWRSLPRQIVSIRFDSGLVSSLAPDAQLVREGS